MGFMRSAIYRPEERGQQSPGCGQPQQWVHQPWKCRSDRFTSLTRGPAFPGHAQATGKEKAVPGVGDDRSLEISLERRAKPTPTPVLERPDRLRSRSHMCILPSTRMVTFRGTQNLLVFWRDVSSPKRSMSCLGGEVPIFLSLNRLNPQPVALQKAAEIRAKHPRFFPGFSVGFISPPLLPNVVWVWVWFFFFQNPFPAFFPFITTLWIPFWVVH